MVSRSRIVALLVLTGLFPLVGCGSSDSATPPAAQISGGEGALDSAAGTLTSSTGARGTPKADDGDPLHPIVEVQTSLGKFMLELDAENAPGTVRNFLNYVNSQKYNQTVFHYVDPGSMILGGGFDEDLTPTEASPPIRNEAHNGLKNLAGTIAMSRPFDFIDGAASQFFINVKDNPTLDHQSPTEEEYGYCVFGKITSGMDIVERISQVEVHPEKDFVNTPKERVVIQSMRFIR